MASKLLSKTNYITGLQCLRLLWVEKNDKKRLPKHDKVQQNNLDGGTSIGEFATILFPEGISLANEEFIDNLKKTKEQLKKRIPIFEAGFKVGRTCSRADILNPVGENQWDIIEVKSATKVKKLNLDDMAFQKYVYQKAGLNIRKCFLMHVDSKYIKEEEIDPKKLLTQTDITEEIKLAEEKLEENIKKMLEIIDGPEPEFSVDDVLTNEYDNIFLDKFMDSLPNENIFEFHNILKKDAVKLYKQGYVLMKDTPKNFKLKDNQKIQKDVALTGKVHINKEKIKDFLEDLKYPIYYLDFETINPIIPLFDGMRPYQRIPFQYSLHIEQENSDLKHISFLAEGTEDPRAKFMQSLKDNLGEEGTILVYNEGFEKGVLRECAEAFPEFQEWYSQNVLPRIKDLLDVFRKFDYYDPKQKGSASIKAVLPVMSDLSYKDLEIVQKGDEAGYEWERVTFNDVDLEERKKVREALEKYCELDTLAEVKIVERLREIVNS